MMPSRFLFEKLRSSYIRYMTFGHLMSKNTVVLPLLGSLEKGLEDSNELGLSCLDSNVIHATGGSFAVILIEMADVHINKPTKSMDFHAPSFYRFREQLLQKLCELFGWLSESLKPSFLGFMNEKLVEVPDERTSVKPLYWNKTRLFKNNTKN